MPHEMFADAVVRPISPRARRRRRLLTVVSIALHVVVIVPLAVGQVLATGSLPSPRQPVIFEIPNVTPVVNIPAPAPPVRGPVPPVVEDPNVAPLEAPPRVVMEPERPVAPVRQPGVIDGVQPGFHGDLLTSQIDHLSALPPPAPPTEPIHLHTGMQPPRKVVDVPLVYPPIAIAARKEGVVILEAIIDAHGNVQSVRALRSDPLLEQAAVDAVRQWKYTPTLLNGVAVPIIMTVTVNFKLQ